MGRAHSDLTLPVYVMSSGVGLTMILAWPRLWYLGVIAAFVIDMSWHLIFQSRGDRPLGD